MTDTKYGKLTVVPIEKIVSETPASAITPVKSIVVRIPEMAQKALPGQFVMLWLLGNDEKPMGIASSDPITGKLTFAIARIGKTTKALHQLKEGALIGVRGPYGKSFSLKGKRIAIIGGGTGIAPTKFLAEKAIEEGLEVTLVHGAKSKKELAFRSYFEALAQKKSLFHYFPTTDDGSYGFKGFATDGLQHLYQNNPNWDYLYTCGPERMMYKVFQLATTWSLPLEASLADRYFKCAIGLCGQCSLDPLGIRLCIEGPVLPKETLVKLTDIEKYSRYKYGKKYPL